MQQWIFGQWRTLGFVALSTLLIYGSVVVAIRLGERRTLAEMTAYDFAVGVALGAIIGRTATTPSPSYVQGLTAVVTLLVCHHALSWLRFRHEAVRRVTNRPPLLLVIDGEVDREAMATALVTDEDLEVVLREHGIDDVRDARVVVLESRGAFSVIRRRA